MVSQPVTGSFLAWKYSMEMLISLSNRSSNEFATFLSYKTLFWLCFVVIFFYFETLDFWFSLLHLMILREQRQQTSVLLGRAFPYYCTETQLYEIIQRLGWNWVSAGQIALLVTANAHTAMDRGSTWLPKKKNDIGGQLQRRRNLRSLLIDRHW